MNTISLNLLNFYFNNYVKEGRIDVSFIEYLEEKKVLIEPDPDDIFSSYVFADGLEESAKDLDARGLDEAKSIDISIMRTGIEKAQLENYQHTLEDFIFYGQISKTDKEKAKEMINQINEFLENEDFSETEEEKTEEEINEEELPLPDNNNNSDENNNVEFKAKKLKNSHPVLKNTARTGVSLVAGGGVVGIFAALVMSFLQKGGAFSSVPLLSADAATNAITGAILGVVFGAAAAGVYYGVKWVIKKAMTSKMQPKKSLQEILNNDNVNENIAEMDYVPLIAYINTFSEKAANMIAYQPAKFNIFGKIYKHFCVLRNRVRAEAISKYFNKFLKEEYKKISDKAAEHPEIRDLQIRKNKIANLIEYINHNLDAVIAEDFKNNTTSSYGDIILAAPKNRHAVINSQGRIYKRKSGDFVASEETETDIHKRPYNARSPKDRKSALGVYKNSLINAMLSNNNYYSDSLIEKRLQELEKHKKERQAQKDADRQAREEARQSRQSRKSKKNNNTNEQNNPNNEQIFTEEQLRIIDTIDKYNEQIKKIDESINDVNNGNYGNSLKGILIARYNKEKENYEQKKSELEEQLKQSLAVEEDEVRALRDIAETFDDTNELLDQRQESFDTEEQLEQEEQERQQAEEQEKARQEAEEQERLAAEKARQEAEEQERLAAEEQEKARQEAEEQERLAAEKAEQERLEEQERQEMLKKLNADIFTFERLIKIYSDSELESLQQEYRTKFSGTIDENLRNTYGKYINAIKTEQVIRTAEEQARREAEEQKRLEAEEQARREAEEQKRLEAEEQARREAEEQEQARREAEEQEQARQEPEGESLIYKLTADEPVQYKTEEIQDTKKRIPETKNPELTTARRMLTNSQNKLNELCRQFAELGLQDASDSSEQVEKLKKEIEKQKETIQEREQHVKDLENKQNEQSQNVD